MKKITSFKFQTGSYFGSHERIEFKKGKLTYTYSNYPFHFIDNPPNVIERVIDENELEPLIAMLPMFQDWEKHNHDSEICDGFSWALHIRCGRKHIICAGYCTDTPDFNKMCDILEKLTGPH